MANALSKAFNNVKHSKTKCAALAGMCITGPLAASLHHQGTPMDLGLFTIVSLLLAGWGSTVPHLYQDQPEPSRKYSRVMASPYKR